MIEAPPKIDPCIRRTRQMLFHAFQSHLVEKTFDLITVQDIAEQSPLNRATFYDHFTDKFALLEAMMGERFAALIEARTSGNKSTCETALRHLILGTCDFLAEVSSGCQKHQRQFEPLVESQVKAILREYLLAGLRSHGAKSPELRATMVSWAITGAAMQWSREKNLGGRSGQCGVSHLENCLAGRRVIFVLSLRVSNCFVNWHHVLHETPTVNHWNIVPMVKVPDASEAE